MLVAAVIPVAMSAQAQITTKKMKLEDFPEKITKIVLSGNAFLDGELKAGIKNHWTISPYEFCTLDEFDRLKGSEDYYFLLTVLGQFRKEIEPGIEMLSLVKGGKGSDKNLDKMLEVVTIPLRSADYPSGRELIFLPAIIDIIQSHVLASMEKDIIGYSSLGQYCINIAGADGMSIIISENDLAEQVGESFIESIKNENFKVVCEEEADEMMEAGAANTLVSYTVAPYDAQNGSYCYKMLINARTHKLYYFRKHKISRNAGSGFLPEDIIRIAGK